MISILIPTFNDRCKTLATRLSQQATAIESLQWEIIVADDASTDEEAVMENRSIAAMPHCRYVRQDHNMGRANIRNLLAETARGEWLLYIDGDGCVITPDYLQRFVEAAKTSHACYGGYRMMPGPDDNLRWRYEREAAPHHTAALRQQHPYHSFKISNLLIRRDLMLAHRLDSRFVKYGYEDVLLGKQLHQSGVQVSHIDAPIGFFDYETNAHFVAKTEESLQTLHEFQDEIRGYSALLDAVGRMSAPTRWSYGLCFRLMKKIWRSNLCGTSPSLLIFKLYKLGYFLTLSEGATAPKD